MAGPACWQLRSGRLGAPRDQYLVWCIGGYGRELLEKFAQSVNSAEASEVSGFRCQVSEIRVYALSLTPDTRHLTPRFHDCSLLCHHCQRRRYPGPANVIPATVEVRDGRIAAIKPSTERPATYLLPGFIDAHVHIESSMLVPSEFARAAVVHGTVATVSDPHEIGNVLGVAGVRYMLENAAQVPFKFNFGAPSCVPATTFETAGAEITVAEVEQLLDDPRIRYLSEMMNFPGILHGDPACLAKVKAAHDRGKPVDGHAPGLRGERSGPLHRRRHHDRSRVLHEGRGARQARGRLQDLIREGSAARNFDALYTLLGEYPGQDDAVQRRQAPG